MDATRDIHGLEFIEGEPDRDSLRHAICLALSSDDLQRVQAYSLAFLALTVKGGRSLAEVPELESGKPKRRMF